MHEIYNYLNKIVPKINDKNKFIENYKKILKSNCTSCTTFSK